MGDRTMHSKESYANRRKFLKAASVVGGISLAGCNSLQSDGNSDGTGDSQGMGPSTESLVIAVNSGFGSLSQTMEQMANVFKSSVERIGVNVEVSLNDVATNFSSLRDDKRTFHYIIVPQANAPTRLDPQYFLARESITRAGGDGENNFTNYASCKFTNLGRRAARASSNNQRRKLTNQAFSLYSNEVMPLSVSPRNLWGAYRESKVDIAATGELGIASTNNQLWRRSTPKNGDNFTVNIGAASLETLNFLVPTIQAPLRVMGHQLHSPLVEYDHNLNLQNILAESYDYSNGGKQLTVKLRDATFHDGSQVTSEDVKFTYEHIENYSRFPYPPIESIETPNDMTTIFNFSQTYIPFITFDAPTYGILHKDSWVAGGAPDSPQEYSPDKLIGSGPFRQTGFEQGQVLQMAPFKDHPVFNVNHGIIWRGFEGSQTTFQSFRAGEIDIFQDTGGGLFERVRNEVNEAKAVRAPGFMMWMIYPQMQYGPTKFPAFRDAVGKAFNRQNMNQTAFGGLKDSILEYASLFQSSHPWQPPEEDLHTFTEDPTGDVEAARQVLRNAGWTWDNNDQLHYPADANTSPRWPKGETPKPSNHPCLNSEGEYILPQKQ